MPHQIRVSSPAAKALGTYPKNLQRRIVDRINELGINPRPGEAETLSGNRDLLRVRVGGFRIVYQFDEAPGLVTIVRIGSRGDVYRKLAQEPLD